MNRSFTRSWSRFWFLETDARTVVRYRIALAGFLLVWLISLGPVWLELYGPTGISIDRLIKAWSTSIIYPLPLRIQSDTGMWIYYGSAIAAAIVLLFGGKPAPFATAWLWLTVLWLSFSNRFSNNGEEQVMHILLFLSLGLPLGVRWNETKPVPLWSLRAIQIHLMAIYLISFPAKLTTGPQWLDGSAVYYATMTREYPRWLGVKWIGEMSPLLSYATLAVELVLPILFWWPRYRRWCVHGFMAIHVGMAIFLSGVVMFNLAMMVGLVLLYPSAAAGTSSPASPARPPSTPPDRRT